MVTEPTPLERRALAVIWNDVEPGFGEKWFGPPGSNDDRSAILGRYQYRYPLPRQFMHAYRPTPKAYRRGDDGVLIVSCSGAKGRDYDAHLRVEPDGAVTVFAIGRAFQDGVIGRFARPEEYDSVAELLRDAPVITGERSFSIWLKRLPDALAMHGDCRVAVAERHIDGRLLAARIGSVRIAIFQGEKLSVGQAYQAGVRPEARGQGLENALIPYVFGPNARRIYGLIDAGNVAIVQSMGGKDLFVWSHGVRQIGIPATRDAQKFGRPATIHDAPRILDLLIAAHGQKEWRPPFDLDWVQNRFSTIASYGFGDIRMTEHAFVALWPAGDVIADRAPTRSRDARYAYLADYGFAGDRGRADFGRLLSDAQGRAYEAGCTHAVGYTCGASPGVAELTANAEIDDRMFLTLPPPEPASVSETGIFVDPFYV